MMQNGRGVAKEVRGGGGKQVPSPGWTATMRPGKRGGWSFCWAVPGKERQGKLREKGPKGEGDDLEPSSERKFLGGRPSRTTLKTRPSEKRGREGGQQKKRRLRYRNPWGGRSSGTSKKGCRKNALDKKGMEKGKKKTICPGSRVPKGASQKRSRSNREDEEGFVGPADP